MPAFVVFLKAEAAGRAALAHLFSKTPKIPTMLVPCEIGKDVKMNKVPGRQMLT